MSIVLYVGGSKDGTRGVMPEGLTKMQTQTADGVEIYSERILQLDGVGRLRVMALEGMPDDRISQHLRSAGVN